MKQLFKITALLLFVFISAGLTACSDDDDKEKGNNESIIDTWMCSDDDYEEGEFQIFIFNADGTCFEFERYYDSYTDQFNEYRYSYNYSYRNGLLTIYNYDKGRDYVVSVILSGNSMRLVEADGDASHYVRQGGNAASPGASFVGSWRFDFGSGGYQVVTLNANGTGSFLDVDYVNGQMYSETDIIVSWAYSNGKLWILFDDGETDIYSVRISGNAVIVDGDYFVRVG